MPDFASDPDGLDRVADRFKDLSDDSTKISEYWANYAVPLTHQTGKGLPALALPSLSELTPAVDEQSRALKEHVATVETALRDTACLYRRSEQQALDQVNTIWNNVPQSDDTDGRSGGGLQGIDLPSDETLNTPPEPIGPGLWKVSVDIATALGDIEAESIVISWMDELLGGIFGENPTVALTEWVTGDWEALGTVGRVFENFRDYCRLMPRLLSDATKAIGTEGQWDGAAKDAAFDAMMANANRVDGLADLWHDAKISYENWQNIAYILLSEVHGLLITIPAMLVRGKDIVYKAWDIPWTVMNTVKGAFTGENYLAQLLEELLGIALAILNLFKKCIQTMFYVLQAFVALCSFIPLLEGSTDLDRAW